MFEQTHVTRPHFSQNYQHFGVYPIFRHTQMFSLKHAAFIPFHEENGNARASNFLPQMPSVGSEGNDQLCKWHVQCGAPKIAKLAYNSNFTRTSGRYIELVNGIINQRSHHVWGHHLVVFKKGQTPPQFPKMSPL